MTDPNWLPSTLAQATAALVAIVGGFLVSRLVSLSGERSGLANRRIELTERVRLAQGEHDRVHSARLDVSIEWFREHHLDSFVADRGQVDVEKALDDFIPRGSSHEEMRPVAESLAAKVASAWEKIDAAFGDAEFPSGKIEHLRSRLGAVPDDEVEIYERVGREIADARRAQMGQRSAGLSSLASFAALRTTQNLTYERQDARIAKEEELRAQLATLRSELDLTREQLARLADPQGIYAGMAVLTVFAIVGVLFPMAVMSIRPVPSGATVRISMVVAFALGFAGLIGYIGISLRRLRATERELGLDVGTTQ